MRRAQTPLGALARGLVAGAMGTAAMTAYQLAVLKARGSEPSTLPAEVGRRLVEGVFEREVPEDRVEQLNTAVHLLYGTAWGGVYGIVAPSLPSSSALRHGAVFGAAVWATSLVELPAMKLSPPPWAQPGKELALDASYHLVYGLALAEAHAALDR